MSTKLFNIVLLIFIWSSCSAQIKILGNYAPHFDEKQLKEIRLHLDPKKVMKEMVVGAIIVSDSQKIGLYKCMIYKQPSSVNAIHKILKFNNKIVYYSKNADENERHLAEFEREYKNIFTSDQLKTIRESFLRGTEVAGRVM